MLDLASFGSLRRPGHVTVVMGVGRRASGKEALTRVIRSEHEFGAHSEHARSR